MRASVARRQRPWLVVAGLAALVLLAIGAGPEARQVVPLAWAGEPTLTGSAAPTGRERALGAWLMDAREIIEEILVEEEGEIPERGAVVLGVERQGPADRAGLEPADAIVELAGERVVGTTDLWRILASRPGGSALPMTFVRGGQVLRSRLEVVTADRFERWLPPTGRRRFSSAAW